MKLEEKYLKKTVEFMGDDEEKLVGEVISITVDGELHIKDKDTGYVYSGTPEDVKLIEEGEKTKDKKEQPKEATTEAESDKAIPRVSRRTKEKEKDVPLEDKEQEPSEKKVIEKKGEDIEPLSISVNDLLEELIVYGQLSIPDDEKTHYLAILQEIQTLLGVQIQE